MPNHPEAPRRPEDIREAGRVAQIEHLRSCFEDWSNEIPTEIVHNEGKSKARSAWFALVTGRVELALEFIDDEVFSAEVYEELDPVIALAKKHAGAPEGENRNTKEQIDVCDHVLMKVMARLRNA